MSNIGTFCSVRVYDWRTGETRDMWQPDLAYVTSVSVQLGLGFNPMTTVSLDLPYIEGLKLLSETSLFNVGNIWLVRLGYSAIGRSTPWFSGFLKDPGVTIGPNGVQLTLQLAGAGAQAMTLTTVAQLKGTVESIVGDIATRFSWKLDTEGADLTREINITGNGANYWQVLFQVLAESGNVFWISNNADPESGDYGKATLYIRKAAEKLTEEAWTLTMFGKVDVPAGNFPLLSFSAPNKASFLPSLSYGARSVYMDPEGNIVEITASEGETEDPGLGGDSVEAGEGDEADPESGQKSDTTLQEGEQGAQVSNPSGPEGKEQETLQNLRDESFNGYAAIRAECSTIGFPELLPKAIVLLRGVSSRFDGLYEVQSVVHSVSSAGFDTTFSARRNARPEGTGIKEYEGSPATEPEGAA